MNRREAIKHIKLATPKGQHVALALWGEDDVLGQAKERGIRLSRRKAREIIDNIDRRQDATIGITWDTIDFYLEAG